MELLEEYLQDINISYTAEMLSKFNTYYELLIEWNNKFNLTAITDKEEVIIKHFADSLYGYKHIVNVASVVDIGSGAGFPSIPLAIVLPDTRFALVDSLNKRVNFLNEVISSLNLTNCTAFHSRAEDYAKNNRNKYDVAVARAVAQLPTLLEYLVPLVKVGGKTVCYKAITANEEISISANAIKTLNCSLESADEYSILDTTFTRSLVVCRVNNTCKPIYPREKNLPKTNPL